MADQKYTREQVLGKNGRNGNPVWIIIKDVVYDVTPYVQQHPGGEDVLLGEAGKDATKEFEAVGHSSDARSIMKKYRIGEIVEPKKPVPKPSAKAPLVPQKKQPNPATPSSSSSADSPPTASSNPPNTATCDTCTSNSPTSTSAVVTGSSRSSVVPSTPLPRFEATSGPTLPLFPAAPSLTVGTGFPNEQTAGTSIVSPAVPSASALSDMTLKPIETPSVSTLAVSATPTSNIPTTLTTFTALGVADSSTTVSAQMAGTSTVSPAVTFASSVSRITIPLVVETSSSSTVASSAAVSVSHFTTSAALAASTTTILNTQTTGLINTLPTSEAAVTSSSAFERPARVPKNVPIEVPRNVTDEPDVSPVKEKEKTVSKPTLASNASSTAVPKAAPVKQTPSSNYSKSLNGSSLANGQKTGILGKLGSSPSKTTNGQSMTPSISIKGLSMKSSLATSSAKPTNSSIFKAASKTSSSAVKSDSKQSTLPWNSSSKSSTTTSNAFGSSSSSNSKSGSYDPYKKDKGSFGSFSGLKKK